jgi:hypothetical protein
VADYVVHWDRMNAAHRERFALMLAPLIAASRTKDYETKERATVQLHTWMLSMREVPAAVLEEAIASLVNAGVKFMPKPGELKAECAKVMATKRKAAAALHLESCDHSSQWVDGPNGLERCPCWKRAQQAMADVGQAIALPPSREEALEVDR